MRSQKMSKQGLTQRSVQKFHKRSDFMKGFESLSPSFQQQRSLQSANVRCASIRVNAYRPEVVMRQTPS